MGRVPNRGWGRERRGGAGTLTGCGGLPEGALTGKGGTAWVGPALGAETEGALAAQTEDTNGEGTMERGH